MISEFFKVDNDDNHTYKWYGPTVSEIVQALNGGNYYDSIPKPVLEKAIKRGVCVHQQLETSNFRCHCEEQSDMHCWTANAIGDLVSIWNTTNELEVVGREIAFATRYFVGTADLILKAKNAERYFVCDYKTSYDVHMDDWKVQLALYYYGLFKLPKNDVTVIVFWAHQYSDNLKSKRYTITIKVEEIRDIVKRAKAYVKTKYSEYLFNK
jgi:hypothetical protein